MKALGLAIGVAAPDLGAIGLVSGHLAAQGGEAAGASEFDQQIGAEGRKTAALLRGEGQGPLEVIQSSVPELVLASPAMSVNP